MTKLYFAIISGSFMLIVSLLLKPILIAINVPDTIFDDAYSYIFIICLGSLGTFAYNLFANILRAVGNSKASIIFLVVSGVVNIGLDYLLMFVFGTGIIGAAIATISATFISAFFCIYYVLKHYKKILPVVADYKHWRVPAKELLGTGFAMALMYCVVDFGSIIFQGATNNLGDLYITSHTAARRIIILLMTPLIALANGNATFTGQNWGAGNRARIQSTIKKVMLLEVIIGVITCALVYLTDSFLIRITTGSDNPDIIKNGVLSLRIHLPFYAPLGILFVIRTALQAMGKKIVPIISSTMELLIKILFAIIIIPRLGFIGTCITEPIIWVVCMIFLIASARKFLFSSAQV